MKKEVLLATNFAKAPKGLQDATNAHAANLRKYQKAKAKLDLDSKAVDQMYADLNGSELAFAKELNAWDGEPVA